MRSNVEPEEPHGVARQWIFADDDGVPLEESVGLVARQEKLEKQRLKLYCVAFGHLLGVPKSRIVRKGEFPKSHQCKETNAELGAKKKVVV